MEEHLWKKGFKEEEFQFDQRLEEQEQRYRHSQQEMVQNATDMLMQRGLLQEQRRHYGEILMDDMMQAKEELRENGKFAEQVSKEKIKHEKDDKVYQEENLKNYKKLRKRYGNGITVSTYRIKEQMSTYLSERKKEQKSWAETKPTLAELSKRLNITSDMFNLMQIGLKRGRLDVPRLMQIRDTVAYLQEELSYRGEELETLDYEQKSKIFIAVSLKNEIETALNLALEEHALRIDGKIRTDIAEQDHSVRNLEINKFLEGKRGRIHSEQTQEAVKKFQDKLAALQNVYAADAEARLEMTAEEIKALESPQMEEPTFKKVWNSNLPEERTKRLFGEYQTLLEKKQKMTLRLNTLQRKMDALQKNLDGGTEDEEQLTKDKKNLSLLKVIYQSYVQAPEYRRVLHQENRLRQLCRGVCGYRELTIAMRKELVEVYGLEELQAEQERDLKLSYRLDGKEETLKQFEERLNKEKKQQDTVKEVVTDRVEGWLGMEATERMAEWGKKYQGVYAYMNSQQYLDRKRLETEFRKYLEEEHPELKDSLTQEKIEGQRLEDFLNSLKEKPALELGLDIGTKILWTLEKLHNKTIGSADRLIKGFKEAAENSEKVTESKKRKTSIKDAWDAIATQILDPEAGYTEEQRTTVETILQMLRSALDTAQVDVVENSVNTMTSVMKALKGMAGFASLGTFSTAMTVLSAGISIGLKISTGADREKIQEKYVENKYAEITREVQEHGLFKHLSERDIRHGILEFCGTKSGKRTEASILAMATDSKKLLDNKDEKIKAIKLKALDAMHLSEQTCVKDVMQRIGATEKQARNPMKAVSKVRREEHKKEAYITNAALWHFKNQE